ncbi:uncharacterized protein FYW61_009523 [Anableps anableps]
MVSLNQSGYFLTWKAGAGTPAGTVFTINTINRNSRQVSKSNCRHIQSLICNLTEAFDELSDSFDIQVTPRLGNQTSQPADLKGYVPIAHLPLPKLNVTFCSPNICVDSLPPYPRFQDSYNRMEYQLRIERNGDDKPMVLNFRSLQSQKVYMALGREHCVSIRFASTMLKLESNFSQPECIFVPGHFNSDAAVAVVLCSLVLPIIGVFALLFGTGFICLKRSAMPSVLTSINHIEEVRVSSCGDSLSSLLNVRVMAPPVGRNNYSNSEESDEESCTQTSGRSSSGENYTVRLGVNPLSSTSSSLSSSSGPPPPSSCSSQSPDGSALQPEVLVVIETQPGAELNPQRPESLKTEKTEEEEEEKKKEGINVEQEVNLLTLTFGWPEKPEEEKAAGQDVNLLSLTFAQPEKQSEEEDCPDVPDEAGALAAPLVQPPQPAAASPCATDEEEEDACGDYMHRHPAAL